MTRKMSYQFCTIGKYGTNCKCLTYTFLKQLLKISCCKSIFIYSVILHEALVSDISLFE